MLNDAVGKPLLAWDSRAHRLRQKYDALHRPTNLYVRSGDGVEFLAERVVYGEGQPNHQERNLKGKVFRQFDGAGIVTSNWYDFKGNLLSIVSPVQNFLQLPRETGAGRPFDWSREGVG